MYYIRVWYKDSKGKIFHEDEEYSEVHEFMKCVPYRAEIIDDSSIIYKDEEKLYPKYDKNLDIIETKRLKFNNI